VRFLAILVALGFFAGTAQADRPKNYRINLSMVSSVGDAGPRPGEYKLLVDVHAPTVCFTDMTSGKQIEVEAQVEIYSQNIDGTNRIVEIRLGGTKTKVCRLRKPESIWRTRSSTSLPRNRRMGLATCR
jgi:hypothetical protein